MNTDTVNQLTRDLTFISKMVALSVEKNDKESAIRYINSAGNLLNKITEEVMK